MFNKAIFVVLVLFASIGVGASTCPTGCDYTAPTTIEQGQQVHLQGPASSPQGRPLDYEWRIYLCDGTDVSQSVFGGPQTNRDLYFQSPPYGDYRVALTVRDRGFPTTCYDVKSICGTSTQGGCPTFCCGDVCEADPVTSTCPFHVAYTGVSGANYEYRWLLDGHVYKYGTAESDKEVVIDWSQATFVDPMTGLVHPIGYGNHAVSFEIWAPDPATGNLIRIKECPSTCNIYKVQKPVAQIALIM
jgi:hypothetical protein